LENYTKKILLTLPVISSFGAIKADDLGCSGDMVRSSFDGMILRARRCINTRRQAFPNE